MPRAAPVLALTAALLCGGLALAAPPSSASPAPASAPASVPAPAESCTLGAGPLPTQTRAVFVLDTSGSMRGIGDGRADIFGRVKASVSAYVASARPDRVDLVTFDGGLRTRRGYALPAEAAAFARDLAALRADGSNTYLYRSLRDALAPLSGGGRYLTDVFLLTDGIDNNPRRQVGAAQALAAFRGRGVLDRLTYLALGTEIPAEAQSALARSAYARGLSLPLGVVPDLTRVRATLKATVSDPAQVPAPYPDGTPLRLAAQPGGPAPTLARPQASGGRAQLVASTTRSQVPPGTVALLCAGPVPTAVPVSTAGSAARPPAADPLAALPPQRVLLTLNLPAPAPQGWRGWLGGVLGGAEAPATPAPADLAPALASAPTAAPAAAVPGRATPAEGQARWLWLNPGADRRLSPGEDTALRYRAAPGTDLRGARLDLPGGAAGLVATLEAQPGAREFAVRLRRTAGSGAGQEVAARLVLASGETLTLPGVVAAPEGDAAGQTVTLSPVNPVPPTLPEPAETGTETGPGLRPLAPWVLGGAALLALLAGLAWRRRSRRQPVRRGAGAAAPARHSFAGGAVPTVEGLSYKEDRTLALVMAGGETSSVPTPLGGPFDIGLLARVPHLSGVRAEQHRDGLRLLHVPADLEVRQGGRLLRPGDVVRPGTLLGVAVADASRAPHPPLGSLVGLGLPLRLRPDASGVQVVGPYATHTLDLSGGVRDLGEVFGAPALRGLKLSLSGGRALLADLPAGLSLTRTGDPLPLRPGTYLPPEAELGLPER